MWPDVHVGVDDKMVNGDHTLLQHVGVPHQRLENFLALRVLEIERQALLAGIEIEEQCAVSGSGRSCRNGPTAHAGSPAQGGSTLISSALNVANSLT